ncbi:MAG: protein O-mannosyl-transferase family [Phycisphaerae bacterium]
MRRFGEWRAKASELTNAMRARTLWCCTLVVALTLYAATANRGVQWQDSGWQQLRMVTGQLEHPYGLALYHPLHYYLGRVALQITFLEPAFAVTLVSSVAAALAIANVAATLLLLTRRIAPAVIAAAALLFSHTLWRHATYTESYALVAALLSGEWLCLACFVSTGKARYLPLLALLNGLGIANHLLATLATPVDLAVIVWAVRRKSVSARTAIAAGSLWLVGTTPYAVLVIVELIKTRDPWGTIQTALFARYASEVLNTRIEARRLVMSLGYACYNFPGLTFPLAVVGLVARKALPTALKRAWLVQLGLFVLFVVRYNISDQYTFFFPVYILLVLFAGVGLGKLSASGSLARRRRLLALAAITAAWTPLIYLSTAHVLAARGALAAMVKNKPYRDGYRAFFVPWGCGADHATTLNDAVRELAGNDGLVLVADHMQVFAIRYAQAVGQLPDTVTIVEMPRSPSEQVVAKRRVLLSYYLSFGRPVVLVPLDRYRPVANLPQAQWQRHGDVYRLTALPPSTTSPSPIPK